MKCEELAFEIRRMHQAPTHTLPIVNGALGTKNRGLMEFLTIVGNTRYIRRRVSSNLFGSLFQSN